MIDVCDMPRTVGAPRYSVKSIPAQQRTSHAALALYHAAKRFGIEKLAAAAGMNAEVLRKKLNPNCETHHVTLDEAQGLTAAMNDPACAIAFARDAGLACIPLPRAQDGSLHKGMSEIAKEFSELMSEFAEATRDNVISDNDCARFEREGTDLFLAYCEQLARMRAAAANREPVVAT